MMRFVRRWDPNREQPVLGVWIEDYVVDLPEPYAVGHSLLDLWHDAGGNGVALEQRLEEALRRASVRFPYGALDIAPDSVRPHLVMPFDPPEVWAAGVTYERSLRARLEETVVKDVYDRVYEAERPEVFFKATPSRCVGPNASVRVRADSRWTVPEPEIGLVLDAAGKIVGYTLGNDMSARDIEGVNPLYLPQAKIYNACCSLGPSVIISRVPAGGFSISMSVFRGGAGVFSGVTSTARMRRSFEELVAYLTRDNTVPTGTILLTGTGIVPPDEFALEDGDIVEIATPEIGVLRNRATRLPGRAQA